MRDACADYRFGAREDVYRLPVEEPRPYERQRRLAGQS
jgi:hypothetical protein